MLVKMSPGAFSRRGCWPVEVQVGMWECNTVHCPLQSCSALSCAGVGAAGCVGGICVADQAKKGIKMNLEESWPVSVAHHGKTWRGTGGGGLSDGSSRDCLVGTIGCFLSKLMATPLLAHSHRAAVFLFSCFRHAPFATLRKAL